MKIDINNDAELMLNWTCIQVSERKWRQDQSRVYTTVNWTPAGKVRVDLMTDRDVPDRRLEAEVVINEYLSLV